MSDALRNAPAVEDVAGGLAPSALKECCAAVYDSAPAKLLLDDLFHPGGSKLTERLGNLLALTPQMRVLDVAAGRGASAFFLASQFGCDVVGIDYSRHMIDEAEKLAKSKGLSAKVSFQCADAEQLPFPDGTFDAVICECAFCIFPNKPAAAHEFERVLRSGGRVGLSDLTRNGVLAPQLDSLLSWVACIADAQPLTTYVRLMSEAGLTVQKTEEHNHALAELVDQGRTRLFVAEVLAGLQKLNVSGFDLETAKTVAKHALTAIRTGKLGYAIVAALKET